MKRLRLLAFLPLLLAFSLPARAERIENPTAVFAGLDKITGRITAFDVQIGETVQFGALQVTPRVCYTRPVSDTPQTTTFIEVDEVTLSNEKKRIFSGWMFASSPGLHAIDHPVYDIWLTDCKGGKVPEPELPAASPGTDGTTKPDQQAPADDFTVPQDPALPVD